jgi:cytochrome c553
MNAACTLLAAVGAVLALPAAAQAPASAPPSLEAGKQIAGSGAPNGVTACAACHGAQGEGNPAGGFPRIAGQPAYYLSKQMSSFAGGSRDNAVMTPIAKAMNAQQIRDVSAWYTSLDAPAAPPAGGKRAGAGPERGRVLAVAGDESKHVQACANCHGPNGAGEPPTFPYLAGQHAGYLTAAMAEWKSGARKTDASMQMPAIAKALNDADVAAVAAYYAAQPTPAPAGKLVNIPAGTTLRPAIAARADSGGPKAPSGGLQGVGVGTEQGAPVTGGGQGQGPSVGTGAPGTPPAPVPPPPPPPVK